MRDCNIVSTPFEFISILDVIIQRKVNEHSSATIKGYIEESLEETYLKLGLSNLTMKIEIVDEEGKRQVLFCGVVVDFEIETVGNLKLLSVSLKSGTYLMDLKTHIRVFQDITMTYSDIQESIIRNYEHCDFLLDVSKDVPVNRFFVQYQETDWEFLLRIAKENHTFLVPADTLNGIQYYMEIIGSSRDDIVIGSEFRFIRKTGEYNRKTANDMDIMEMDETFFVFDHREMLNVGEVISYQNMKFSIYKIETFMKDGELNHTYYCKYKKGFPDLLQSHPNITGCSLLGKVMAVTDDKVQVELYEDELNPKQSVRWFLYSTIYTSPDGTGWYCMPEIGDEIRLYFPSGLEEEAYVISAVHVDINSDARKNPDEKSMKTKYNKEVRFTPDSLIMTNNDGMSISILDGEGIMIESDKSVIISASKNIDITSSSDSITLMASEIVDLNQGGTSLVIDDNIQFKGGKLKME